MPETPTITRAQAREALSRIDDAMEAISAGVSAAPYVVAKPAMDTLNALSESVACELGVEVVGHCEGCRTTIFDGDDYITTLDGCDLCPECRPSDEDMARLRAIQANCPKGDAECMAQTEDDHERCGPATVPPDDVQE